jgi:hypothetical protein
VIWDEAEELVKLAHVSHPRIVSRTAGLSPRATELCNRLAANIHDLREDDLALLLDALNHAVERRKRALRR